MPHNFQIGDKVLIANDFDTTKNPKLVPNWKGPGEIIDINDTNAKIKFKNKVKVLNVAKLKHFYENVEKSDEKESDNKNFIQDFNQQSEKAHQDFNDFNDIFNKAHDEGPITRAKARLIKYKDAAQLALLLLTSEKDTIDSLCDPSHHCGCCESEETYMAESKTLPFQWRPLKLAENCCKQWQLKLMKKEAEKINSTQDRCHSNVPECFHEPLMKVAYKLLSRDEATFEELTPAEQKLWNSFKTDQIYRLLTGEADTVPEFRFNWYTVDTTDGYCERPQTQPASNTAPRAIAQHPVQPPAPTPVQPPAVTAKPPRASTSARARFPSSTTSSNTSSRPSTTPSSPRPSTSGTVPKARYSSSTDTAPTPRSHCSTTDSAPSRSPTPPAPAPPPVVNTPPTVNATTPKGSGRLLRLRPEVNYPDLHLGRNLLLGRQQFLKRCRSTRKTVGRAVQQTVDKVQKLTDEFPVISRHSLSSSTASSK
jgi:hypothetical protein